MKTVRRWVALVVGGAACNAPATDVGWFTDGTATTSGSTDAEDTTTSASVPVDDDTTTATGAGSPIGFDVGGIPDVPGNDTEAGLPSCYENADYEGTSVGCEFWAAQLPSEPPFSFEDMSFGISVGNPTPYTATIVIEDMRGPGGSLREITSFQLESEHSELVSINGAAGLLPGELHTVATSGPSERGAFRITSNVPVTAMQIYPVGGGPSHVSEASLLLPINTLDTSHIALGYPSVEGLDPGWIVAIATEDGTTLSTVDGDVELDAFDAWTFQHGTDATGYFVGADKPIAVFSGSSCSFIPEEQYACDHLEEQLVPLATWGTHYVAPRHPPRVPELNPFVSPEPVYWRVVAGMDDTTITLEPPVAMDGEITLENAGDFVEFTATESFVATSDERFMLVQYMSSCLNVIEYQVNDTSPCDDDGSATGDPWMVQVPPVDQWLTTLPFLTDTSYPRDFVVMMREAGTVITLDCLGGPVPDDHFTAIPGTPYEVGWVDLDIDGAGGEGACVDGAQFLSADAPVGVLVGGVDWATSYGYPGGMRLGSLWEPPTEPPG